MTLVLSVLEQGMIYAIMALGIYITYTILDFPDLTVDGSFPLGAALSAVLITKGVNPILTLLISFAAGAFAVLVAAALVAVAINKYLPNIPILFLWLNYNAKQSKRQLKSI